MAPFELARPATLAEALALLDEDSRPFSGGTALMLMMKAGVLRPRRLVSLAGLGLGRIEIQGSQLRVGAMATLRQLETDEAVRRGWPVITRALRMLSNVRVRNVATLGGALAHADPHMDLPPLLAALGARVTIRGRDGERSLPVEDLYAGYLENTLKKNEIIIHLEVPALGGRRAAYLKCTTRTADDWPAVAVAVALGDEERIFVGAATDRPTRLADANAIESLKIEGDLHGSAAYKRELLKVYLKRAIHEARNAGH